MEEMNDTTEQAAVAAEEGPMPTTKTKRTKKPAAKSKAAKPAGTKNQEKVAKTKAPKPKREKVVKDDFVTFAVRLPKADAAAFHKAAGPAKGSHVARLLLVAFAKSDDTAFRAAVKEAREAAK